MVLTTEKGTRSYGACLSFADMAPGEALTDTTHVQPLTDFENGARLPRCKRPHRVDIDSACTHVSLALLFLVQRVSEVPT